MISHEQNDPFFKRKGLESHIKSYSDIRDDLNRVRLNLSFSLNAKILPTYLISNPEEKSARVDFWYQTRVSEIAQEEQAFRKRLDAALDSKAISESDYMKAIMGLDFPTNPFKEARQEAHDAYYKERKSF